MMALMTMLTLMMMMVLLNTGDEAEAASFGEYCLVLVQSRGWR